jgi:hypothetical protein
VTDIAHFLDHREVMQPYKRGPFGAMHGLFKASGMPRTTRELPSEGTSAP